MLSRGIIYWPKKPCSTPEILRDFYYVMQGYIWNKMTPVSLLLQFVVGSAPIWNKYPGQTGDKPFTWTNVDLVHWRKYVALGVWGVWGVG